MRSKYLAFGLLVIYALSNIYLEKILFLENSVLKTVFFLIYFLVWISPLLYLWRKGKITERFSIPVLVLFLCIFYTSILVTSPIPVGRYTPDVAFHGAKVLYCSYDHFFNDPVTSFPSIYPPVYHIIAGSIMRVLGTGNNWYMLNLFHIFTLVILFLSVYLLANSLFNPRAGLLSVLLLGSIMDMPIESGMFFPTPFLLGLALVINSTTLVYLALRGKKWCLYPSGFLTGLAVTIWPAFLPVAFILTIIVFFILEKASSRFLHLLKFILPFLVLPLIVWIPQYMLLKSHHLLGHHSIGQYKGIPGLGWFLDFAVRFILLGGFAHSYKWVVALFGLIYAFLIAFAIMGFRSLGKQHMLQKRFLKLFFILMLVTLPLLHYVFTYMYSRRFQVLFSMVIVIVATFYLLTKLGKYRILGISFMVFAAGFSGIWNFHKVHEYVLENKQSYEIVKKYTTGVLEFFESRTAFGDYIFATARTYREVIFGNIIRFNLVLHREGNYYSLNPELSRKMLVHYNTILYSDDFSLIKKTLGYYNIRYVLIHKKEPPYYPGLKKLIENCNTVYRDEWFSILELD